MKTKKFMAILLAGAMALTALPFAAMAEEITEDQKWEDGHYSETGYTVTGGDVTITVGGGKGTAVPTSLEITDGSSVKIEGNIEGSEVSVTDSELETKGNVGSVMHVSGSKVTVDGDCGNLSITTSVTSDGDIGSDVTVTGDVNGGAQEALEVSGILFWEYDESIDDRVPVYYGSNLRIDGDLYNVDFLRMSNGSRVSIGGDAYVGQNEVNNESELYISGNTSDWNVWGETNISATNNGYVIIEGDMKSDCMGNYVNVDNGGCVQVGGSVYKANAMRTNGYSFIEIGGDVINEFSGVIDANCGFIEIAGDTFGVAAINASERGDIRIGGNVEYAGDLNVDGDNSRIIIGGDLIGYGATNGNIANNGVMTIRGDYDGAYLTVGEDGTLVVEGTMYVGNTPSGDRHGYAYINGETAKLLVYKIETYEGCEDSPEEVYGKNDSVNYIIKTEDGKTGAITLEGTTREDLWSGYRYDSYETAKENDVITVSVDVPKGYKLKAFSIDGVDYEKNEDGTYTLTVPFGGGVSIEALLKKLAQDIVKDEPNRKVPGIQIAVEAGEALVPGAATVKASVKCSDMDYLADQLMDAEFSLDGEKMDAKLFKTALDAEGSMTLTIADELLNTLEAGAHTILMRLPNGRSFSFDITVA